MSAQTQAQAKNQSIVVLNAIAISMMPNGGYITVTPVSIDQARMLVQHRNVVSYIGHEGTAQLISMLLHVNIPTNRTMFIAKEPTVALVVSVMERLPEGKVLSLDELMSLYNAGKIRFYIVQFMPFVSSP